MLGGQSGVGQVGWELRGSLLGACDKGRTRTRSPLPATRGDPSSLGAAPSSTCLPSLPQARPANMDCAKPPEWYIRLRREKSPSAMADKQFTLEQLFSRPYHTVDAAASSSGSGRQKSNGIVGGGILLGRQSSSQPEGPDTRVSGLASSLLIHQPPRTIYHPSN